MLNVYDAEIELDESLLVETFFNYTDTVSYINSTQRQPRQTCFIFRALIFLIMKLTDLKQF